jgi:hypothetical protein
MIARCAWLLVTTTLIGGTGLLASSAVAQQRAGTGQLAADVSPATIQGSGSRVVTIRLPRSSPLVVTATHRGSSNFVIRLVGSGASELLVNEIGSYSGQVAWGDAKRGRYRIAVEADGSWKLILTQPVPSRKARLIPGGFTGRGSKVIRARTLRDLQPVLTAWHRGQSNFVVYAIGYGNLQGETLLVNEIGNYRGQTLVDDMPRGHYLLAVEADGSWFLGFKP